MSSLAQLRNKVQQKLGLDATAASAEETLLTEWINEAIVDVLLRTRVNVNKATMTTTADEGDYTLSSSALTIEDLSYETASGMPVSLQRTTPDQIMRMRTITPAVNSNPRFYAFNGSDMFMFYPTSSTVDTITVYYVPRPTAMSISSHDPSNETYGGIPSEYHKAIELYALAEAAEFTDHQPSGFGAAFRQQYEAKLVELKRAKRHRGGRSLGNATLGRKSLIGANAQYPRG